MQSYVADTDETVHSGGMRGVSMRTPCLVALVAAASLAAGQEPSAFDAGSDNRLGLTFGPDGNRAFWAEWNGAWGSSDTARRTIYTARREDGAWSEPAPALPSSPYSDDDPFVSPDGRWLYFVSDRPVEDQGDASDTNIWRFDLIDETPAEYLSVNSDSAEYSPVLTATGALYFASAREGGPGSGDIYRASPLGQGFAPPEALGPAVNRDSGEWNLWVSADEDELLFEASSRPSNVSVPGDLYYSWRTPAGWTAALPIAGLNTPASDLMPRVHPDGDTVYYTSAPIGGHASIGTADWGRLRAELRAAYAPVLLVANRSSHEVTFVDLSRAEIVERIATGEGPHLLSNLGGGRVAATGYGDFPQPHAQPVILRPPFVETPNSRLTVIDARARTVLLDRVIEGCAKPHASWIVGERAYVTCETERQVLALDLESGQTVGRFDTRQDGSHVLGFEAESRTLAIANTGSASLTLINVDDGDTRIVAVAEGSEGLLVRDGRVWVGNAAAGSVSVVDPQSARVVGTVESVCGFPIALAADEGDRVWVACFASAELVSIGRASLAVERRIRLDAQPLNLILHPRLGLAYVSMPRQNAIAEIDLAAGEELRRIRVGIEPDGLRWAE